MGSPDYDYEALGKMEGTLVFLMGLSNLKEIAENLIRAGKPANTPAAVISDGTTPYQKIVRGTLENIEEKGKASGLQSPAVIVIGETAEYEYRYLSANYKKVGVTATELLWKKLETGLEGMGMQPIPLCNMKVVPTKQMQLLEEKLRHLDRYQWVLFTSQNAIRLFFRKMKQMQVDFLVLAIYDVVRSMTKNIQCLEDLDYLIFVSASDVVAVVNDVEGLLEMIKIAEEE